MEQVKKVEVKKPVEAKKSEMVEVSREDLNKILKKLEDNTDEIKKLSFAADKGRLERFDAMNGDKKPLIRKVKISRFGKNGPIITNWKLIVNESFIDVKGYHEKQIVELITEDKEVHTIDLVDFYRTVSKETEGEIIGSKQENGKEFISIQLEDGRKIELEVAMVN